jgi:type VI secretion system Hcp family effector
VATYTAFFLDLGDKTGTSEDEKHKDTFEIEGLSLHGYNPRTAEQLKKNQTGFATFGHLEFSIKTIDKGTANILKALCTGKIYEKVKIFCCNPEKDGKKNEDWFIIELANGSVVECDVGLANKGEDYMSFSLAYFGISLSMKKPGNIDVSVDLTKHTVT